MKEKVRIAALCGIFLAVAILIAGVFYAWKKTFGRKENEETSRESRIVNEVVTDEKESDPESTTSKDTTAESSETGETTEPSETEASTASASSESSSETSETKETKAPPKAEKVPEQAPFLPKNKVDAVIKTAKKHIGTKYIFGGTTPKGFDCSGFVQYVFKQNGFSLPRTADEQYKLGKRVKKRAELEPGDLVFFTTYEKGASHCGIYLGKNQFIHVSSSKGVRIDSLDDTYWKPRWYGGKHIVK